MFCCDVLGLNLDIQTSVHNRELSSVMSWCRSRCLNVMLNVANEALVRSASVSSVKVTALCC